MIQNQENDEKLHFGLNSGPLDPNSSCHFFFSKIWLRLSLDYHGHLSSYTISEKTNDPVLRKFQDRRTDVRTDRQTAASIGSIKCQFTLKEQCFLDLSISIS